jgi:superfamily II DNA or RNA helicase
MKCTIKTLDEVWCTLLGIHPNHMKILSDEFALYVLGFKHMPLYQLGRWDGKVRFIEKSGKTYIKLLSRIIPYLDKWGYNIELIDNRTYYESPNLIDENIFINTDAQIKLRYYQVEAVNKAIENGDGVLILATSAGKTMITAALSHAYSSMGYNTITIVPSTDLVKQTIETYELVELDTGIFCGSSKDYQHKNVVATWQALQNSPHILTYFKALIYDEMHGAKSTVSSKILNEHCKHIPFKFGVTGTFPKDNTERLTLHCALGEILYEVSAKQLMDEGFITPVEIEGLCIKQSNKPEKFPDYGSERTYLSKNEERIDFISDLVAVKAQEYGNVLVLVNSVSFGEKLTANIEGAVFLYGGIDTAERKEQYNQYKSRNDIITIATFGIASTGISIDEIYCLIMVDANKSFIQTIQTVGRSLRKAEGKEKAHVIDVHSNLFWSKKHFKERKKWYEEAQYPVISEYDIKI